MRFFDQLLVEDWHPLFNMRAGADTKEREMPELQDAVVFEVTNCADHLTEHPCTDPILGRRIAVPDFEVGFFEFRQREKIPDDAAGAVEHAMRFGSHMQIGHVVKIIDMEGSEEMAQHAPGSKWWLVFMDFARRQVGNRHRVLGPSFNTQLVLGYHGDVQHASFYPYFNRKRWRVLYPDIPAGQRQRASAICEPALLAMQLLEDAGCDVFNPTDTGASRTHRRKHGRDLCIYNQVSVPT